MGRGVLARELQASKASTLSVATRCTGHALRCQLLLFEKGRGFSLQWPGQVCENALYFLSHPVVVHLAGWDQLVARPGLPAAPNCPPFSRPPACCGCGGQTGASQSLSFFASEAGAGADTTGHWPDMTTALVQATLQVTPGMLALPHGHAGFSIKGLFLPHRSAMLRAGRQANHEDNRYTVEGCSGPTDNLRSHHGSGVKAVLQPRW